MFRHPIASNSRDLPSLSFLFGMSSHSKKYTKVEGIEYYLPSALPREDWSRSNSTKELVLKR